jgi:hypothetical protein
MQAMVSRYAGVHPEADELDDVVRKTALSLSGAAGFVSFLAVEAGADLLVTVAIFETREDLVAAASRAKTQPASPSPTTAPLPAPEVMTGEIVFQKGL